MISAIKLLDNQKTNTLPDQVHTHPVVRVNIEYFTFDKTVGQILTIKTNQASRK